MRVGWKFRKSVVRPGEKKARETCRLAAKVVVDGANGGVVWCEVVQLDVVTWREVSHGELGKSSRATPTEASRVPVPKKI